MSKKTNIAKRRESELSKPIIFADIRSTRDFLDYCLQNLQKIPPALKAVVIILIILFVVIFSIGSNFTDISAFAEWIHQQWDKASSLICQKEPSPTPTPTVGFCNGLKEHCYYLPTPGDSGPTVATRTAFEDECRWPEIANINRSPSGVYRKVESILFSAGIMIPEAATAEDLPPRIRNDNGTFDDIPDCAEYDMDLPCVYEIVEGDGATGLYYKPLALKFYNMTVKDDLKLDVYIQNANLTESCKNTPVLLKQGVKVVIPKLP